MHDFRLRSTSSIRSVFAPPVTVSPPPRADVFEVRVQHGRGRLRVRVARARVQRVRLVGRRHVRAHAAAAVVAAAVKLAVAGFDALGAAAADLPAAEAAPTSICACRRVCIMLRSQGRGSKARPKFSSQSD